MDSQSSFSLVVGLNLLLGAILCFAGYFVSRARILLGFILGCALAANIALGVSQNAWAAMIAGLVGGAIGALLSAVFYFFGIFLIGALLGGFLGQLVSAAFMHGEPQPAIVSIAALVGGGAALIFRKLRIMATISATAMCGAGCMVFGILIFVLTKSAGPIANFDLFSRHGKFAGYSLLLGWIALSIVGVMVQYRLLPDPEKKAVEKQMDSAATSWDGDSSKV
jgi:hypothetical protein